jgi:hypothetical protein
MTFNTLLDQVIPSITQDQNILLSLLGQAQAETLLSDNPALYAAPTYDEQTGLWTLAQSVANTGNGEYEGVYRGASDGMCSWLQSVAVVAHSAPASPAAPARVLPFGADPATGWVDLASVSALSQQEFSAFSLRSATPFEVTVETRGCEWSHLFDFRVALSPWIFAQVGSPPANYGRWTSGTGIQWKLSGDGRNQWSIKLVLSQPLVVTKLIGVMTGGVANTKTVIQANRLAGQVINYYEEGANQTVNWENSIGIEIDEILFSCDPDNTPGNPNNYGITGITFEVFGLGYNPFG